MNPPLKEYLCPFDLEFMGQEMGMILKITEAANFLNITALSSLMHASLVSTCKDICGDKDKIVATFGPYMKMRQGGF